LRISSGPAVGWFPLAPREHFIPHYTTDANYIRRINYVTNSGTINAPSRYRNQVPGATIVPNQVFMNGNPVGARRAHLPPNIIASQAPIAAPELVRAPRNNVTQMPDRRADGRPGNPAPNPRFINDAPPVVIPGQVRNPPGAQIPKYRAAEPSAGGPLPQHRGSPEPARGLQESQPRGAAILPPAVSVNPPAPPTSRQQSIYVSPQTSTAPSAAARRVDAAPVVPDRQVHPSNSRERNTPQPSVPIQPAPQAVLPLAAPRPHAAHPQPAPKDNGPTIVKPAPENITKPRPERPAEGSQVKN
jgi:hypothetical protein